MCFPMGVHIEEEQNQNVLYKAVNSLMAAPSHLLGLSGCLGALSASISAGLGKRSCPSHLLS